MKKTLIFALVVVLLGVFTQSCSPPQDLDPNDSWQSNKPTVMSVVSSTKEDYYTINGENRYRYSVETDITLKVRKRTDKVSIEGLSLWLETNKRGVVDILMQTDCWDCNQPYIAGKGAVKQFNDLEYKIKVYFWVDQQPLGDFGYKSLQDFKSDTSLTLKLERVTVNGRFNYKFPIKINGTNEKVEVSYFSK